MGIEKSQGVTNTERLLAYLCEKTFLKLWAYPNPYNEKQVELCDLLAVFENHVFIFFDRESLILENSDKDPMINWQRWKKKVIDAQIRTANGAEKYIRKNRPVYLDQAKKVPFPIDIKSEDLVVHKIIVAHGAMDACKSFAEENVYGSLAITYGEQMGDFPFPFFIDLDRDNPVHVFDSHNLPIVFSELDTFYDFTAYLDAKNAAIEKYHFLTYCGEEDLLAHYFMNFDTSNNRHFIGSIDENIAGIFISEGEWKDFIDRSEYKARKAEDEGSYLWDEIIQRTCHFTLEGTIVGASPLGGKSAVHEMAKEPRFQRRVLSEGVIQAIRDFPDTSDNLVRKVTLIHSFYKGKAYVFLQLKALGFSDTEEEHREKRRAILEIACGSAKNRFDHLNIVVGIAIDAPRYVERNSEDFLLMDCSQWTESDKEYYEEANKDWNFFQTKNLTLHRKHTTEFPDIEQDKERNRKKVGRNDPCPCGSGKKYKKCCIGVELQ
ncbi:MAG: SEC-C metal-binding domain-containing protein [Mariprofundaceae bacterium]|nr:SEC-C metal-binding domain-containing protein [Mariprofundaceae bacterium]